ncbi:hypothetical protein JCM16303_002839 [Sporobolomyces ruberrimus]
MKRLFNRKHSPTESPSTPEEAISSQSPTSSFTPSQSSQPQPAPPVGSYALPPPPRVQMVGNVIGWSVAMPTFDFPYLLQFSDYLSSSGQASKEAAKALRQEFKHGAPLAQERAVRLTGILFRNTDHRFREQVASKKFLSELTDLVSSKKTEPNVKEMVYKILSPLAYEYQNDSDLKSLTQTYNKLLSTPSTSLSSFPNTLDPSSHRTNGSPLDPEDPLFTPTGLLPSSSTRSGRPHRSNRGGNNGRGEGIPKELEKVQMRELGERADKARGLARLLNEAVVFNTKEEDGSLETNEMVQKRGKGSLTFLGGHLGTGKYHQEFQTQCIEEQNVLGENMVWATVQAEKSRQELETAQTLDPTAENGGEQERDQVGDETMTPEQREMRRSRLSSNNPFAEVVGGGGGANGANGGRKTEEETILEKILLAHSEIQDALSLLSNRITQARQERQHARDIETATNLSKTFVRGGDDMAVGHEGNYGEGGSKQRWESVEEREQAEHEAMMREQEELDRYEKQNQGQTQTQPQAQTQQGQYGGYGHEESIYSPTKQPNVFDDFGTTPATSTASPYDGLGALESLQGLDFSTPSSPATLPQEPEQQQPRARTSFPSSNPYAKLSLNTAANQPQAQDPFTESPVSSSFLPPQPSEKALGKLRRISTTGRTEDDGEDRQRVLEEQLRDKYRRNVEERDGGGIREV